MRCPLVAEQGHHEAAERDRLWLGKLFTLPVLAVGSGLFQFSLCLVSG